MESKTNCCGQGKLKGSVEPYQDPPSIICELLKDRHFCEKIKEYNNSLAFASLGIEKSEAGPNFKILGKMHHNIGSLGPSDNNKPKFAQLYFYDQENEVENRLGYQTKKLKNTKKKLLLTINNNFLLFYAYSVLVKL